MRNGIVSLLAIAGSCSMAHSQMTRLTYEVSNDGLIWSSDLVALPGQQVEVRARVTYQGPTPVGGLNIIIFQPLIDNWRGGATPDRVVAQTQGGITNTIGPYGGTRTTPMGSVADVPGSYGRITPFASTSNSSTSYYRGFVGTGSNTGLMRIALAHVTNWIGVGPSAGSSSYNNFSGRGGVVAGQLAGITRNSTDPAFNPGMDVVVFKFAVVLSTESLNRTMNIWTPEAGLSHDVVDGVVGAVAAMWYANSSDLISVSTGIEVVGASIHTVPTPGTLAIGVAALAWRRRRRVAGVEQCVI